MNIKSCYMPFRKKLGDTDHEYMKNYKYLEKIDRKVNIFDHRQLIPSALQYIGFYTKRFSEKIGVEKPIKNLLHEKIIVLPCLSKTVDCIISRHFLPKLILHDKPVVLHSTYHPKNFSKSGKEKKRTIKRIEKKFSCVEKVVLSTNVEREKLLNDAPILTDDKIFQAPYFLPNVEPIQEKILEGKFQKPPSIRILFVGSDGKRKGIRNLVTALNKICQQYPDLKDDINVTIVTTDDLPSCKFKFKKYEYLDHDDILQTFRRSHIFCMPTLEDTYGLVYVEAMASGCAVVADNSPIRREILDHGQAGLLSDPHDPDDIAEKLLRLIQSPKYALNIAKRGRQRFQKHYHWRKVGPQYLNLLREASASKAR